MKNFLFPGFVSVFILLQSIQKLNINFGDPLPTPVLNKTIEKVSSDIITSPAPAIADFMVRADRGEKITHRKGHVALATYYIICASGVFPSSSNPAGSPGPFVGEIRAILTYGNQLVPTGWYLCNGQLLTINPHQALFSMIGTSFGGDGRTTFAVPDLGGCTIVGEGNGWTIREKSK